MSILISFAENCCADVRALLDAAALAASCCVSEVNYGAGIPFC